MNKKLYPISILAVGMLVIATQLASFKPASAIHSEISILALPSGSAGETQSLTRVYADPEDTSQVINVLSPGTQVQILGLSESGAWIALAQSYPPFLVGWVPASDVKTRPHRRLDSLPGPDPSAAELVQQDCVRAFAGCKCTGGRSQCG